MQSEAPSPQGILPVRIVTIGVEVNGRLKTYTGLKMTAVGTKYANPNQDECEVTLTNLTTDTRNSILNETSPFNANRTPKQIFVYAGYVSTGTSLIFQGDVISSTISQPPDLTVTVKASTKNFQKGNIVSRSQPASTSLQQIATGVANDLGVALNFQATNKTISNYTFTGSALKQVNKLGESGLVDAYIDNNTLVVKNSRVPLTNRLRILNVGTGMVGIPEMTELGVKVKYFIDNQTVLGGALQIQSVLNPSINGTYVIYKLSFEIASRDVPFYWVAEALRVA